MSPAKTELIKGSSKSKLNMAGNFSDDDCDVEEMDEIDGSFLSSQASNLLAASTTKPRLLNEREKLKHRLNMKLQQIY